MKSGIRLGMKITVFLLGTCLMTFLPIRPLNIGLSESEAEVAESMLLLSSIPQIAILQTSPPQPTVPETLSLEDALRAYDPENPGRPSLPPSDNTQIACTSGIMTYYGQGDPRWADSLYGTSDRLGAYGCGPTALAMIVNSFTQYKVTPLDTAKWASDNGYCSPGEGSHHALIPDGLNHYGLNVTSLTDRSPEAVLNEVRNGKIVIALMNKGYFTNGGHFLLLTRVTDDGKLYIADPASWTNTNGVWDPEFILGQVRTRAESGGPLWSASIPES